MEERITTDEVKERPSDFHEWAIVELFGHQRIAGLVTNATVGGCSFVRVDVPKRAEDGEGVMYSKLYGNGAIYAINITTKEQALAAVANLHPRPYEPRVPERASLPAYDGDDEDGDF